MKAKPKYEVHILFCHESIMDNEIVELQEDCWEMAGDIVVKNEDGHCTHNYVIIPFKRKIN